MAYRQCFVMCCSSDSINLNKGHTYPLIQNYTSKIPPLYFTGMRSVST
uniref:Uncharacterized protein n=1 Tax=Anguilla anguilla TaxID=7936 RepID=A0A0E9PGC6_ANGAN